MLRPPRVRLTPGPSAASAYWHDAHSPAIGIATSRSVGIVRPQPWQAPKAPIVSRNKAASISANTVLAPVISDSTTSLWALPDAAAAWYDRSLS
jgi:hypothetical protein